MIMAPVQLTTRTPIKQQRSVVQRARQKNSRVSVSVKISFYSPVHQWERKYNLLFFIPLLASLSSQTTNQVNNVAISTTSFFFFFLTMGSHFLLNFCASLLYSKGLLYSDRRLFWTDGCFGWTDSLIPFFCFRTDRRRLTTLQEPHQEVLIAL